MKDVANKKVQMVLPRSAQDADEINRAWVSAPSWLSCLFFWSLKSLFLFTQPSSQWECSKCRKNKFAVALKMPVLQNTQTLSISNLHHIWLKCIHFQFSYCYIWLIFIINNACIIMYINAINVIHLMYSMINVVCLGLIITDRKRRIVRFGLNTENGNKILSEKSNKICRHLTFCKYIQY